MSANSALDVINKTVKLDRRTWLCLEVLWRMKGAYGLGEWFNSVVAQLVATEIKKPNWEADVASWAAMSQYECERVLRRTGYLEENKAYDIEELRRLMQEAMRSGPAPPERTVDRPGRV